MSHMSRVSSQAVQTSHILSAAATGLADFIAREGGDPERVVVTAGAQVKVLAEPLGTMSLDSYCRIMAQAASDTRNDNFGLCYGQQFPATGLGMLSYLGLTSRTVREAFHSMGSMFHHHQQRSMLSLREHDGLAYVEYGITDPGVCERRQDAELSVGMFFNILRHALGQDWRPLEVHFQHGAMHDTVQHEHVFGATVRFSQLANAIVFKSDDLNTPMPKADEHLHSLMHHNLRRLGLAPMRVDTLVDRVRAAIRQRLDGSEPTLEDIANSLGMANWTFQRRLRTAGVSYQEILLKVRQEMALEYLRDPALQISELSFLLGYSEISAFSRAFHKWNGMPPSEWRRQNLLASSRLQ